jgi:cytochrome c biogenesis protein CcmG/thiol:disulfide interchange protein DsbE
MRRPRTVIAAVAVIVVLAIGLTQLTSTSTQGGRAPSLSAAQRQLAGSPPPLDALHHNANALLPVGQLSGEIKALRGYPIVVNVWGSWCPPCRAEFPVFQRVSAAVGRRVAFIGIATQDARHNAASFLAKHPVSYPSYLDFDGSVRASYGLLGTPSTLYYDRNGKKAFLHQGPYRSDAALKADIKRYTGA